MKLTPLICYTDKGLYCQEADIYIDPHRKVSKALITHGHSDHARAGHKEYLCSAPSELILQQRLGKNRNITGIPFGETILINGVKFSFHPAGHIAGSAQIRVELKGEIWVISGDYKTENDGLIEPFELVPCHHFITECTFGLPVYRWENQRIVFQDINQWWQQNIQSGTTSVLIAYSLGKAQRLVKNVNSELGPIFCYYTIHEMNQVYRTLGYDLPDTELIDESLTKEELKNALLITPHASKESPWLEEAESVSIASASGWLMTKKGRRRLAGHKGFVLSDHCDWYGLIDVIKNTGAENIYPTHGPSDILSHYLNEEGFNATPIESVR